MTKLLVASLLSDKRCKFYNVPNIGDVEVTVALCQEIGMQVQWDREAGIMEVITKELKTSYVPQRFSGANRIPILMIGALLGRTDEDIIVPTVGGCAIGPRSVDFHIEALEKLGASIEYRGMKKEGAYFAHAHNGLKGTVITLPYPSVGATENTILASVTARGNHGHQKCCYRTGNRRTHPFPAKAGSHHHSRCRPHNPHPRHAPLL